MLRRPLAACAVLLAAYLAISLFNDPDGYLGTDTGGKVATLKVMDERGRFDPDIGYWAEKWDPDGRVHPLYYTTHVGHRWINATTLPVLYAALPLYKLGGYRLALLLPMLGSVLAALAARALARRLGGDDGRAWAAFWIVGLASPLTIYALDIWEHSLGVAAMAWGVVFLIDALERPRGWPRFLAAGALFGAAVTMRNEALVYGFVAVAAACLVLLVKKRQPVAAVLGGLAATAGLLAPLVLNNALEVATAGDPLRFNRATGTASSAVAGTGTIVTGNSVANTRVQEAVLNAVGLNPIMEPASYLVGLGVLILLAFVCVKASRRGDAGPAVIAAAGIGLLYLARFADGPGFVPGLVAATPLAVAGVVLGWTSPASRYALAVAVATLPVVWATQFSGGAAPQWAGRYLLVSGLLLGVAGVVALPRLRRWARTGLVGLAVAITAFGVVWTSIRTHSFANATRTLSHRPEPVLISRIGHLAREGGAFYDDHRWLTAPSASDEAFAVEVVKKAGFQEFALVELAPDHKPHAIPGWRQAGTDRVTLVLGLKLAVTTYEAT